MRIHRYLLAFSALAALSFVSVLPPAKPAAQAKLAPTPPVSNDKAVYWNTLAATSDYYARLGMKRPPAKLQPFLDSSHRVARMIKGFPTDDHTESAHALFAYGGQESVYRKSFVNINFPGQSFKNGTSVRRFSVDWGWIGLNDINISLTYTTAKCLRDNKPFPAWVQASLHKDARTFLRSNMKIPKDMNLKWLRPGMAKDAKKQWRWARSKKMTQKTFKKRFNHKFSERSSDDLDSMLLYRVIVEIDRRARGWEYKTWSKDVYTTLRRVRRDHKKEQS